MKSIIICSFFVLAIGCKSKMQKDAEHYQSAVSSVVDNYTKPTSKDGLYLSANVNGKEWTATHMLVDMDNSHPVVQAYNESNAVIIFYLSTRMKKGEAHKFQGTGGSSAQYSETGDARDILIGQGERTVTKMDDNWIEGSFQFTATDDQKNKKVEVTNGFFRIPKPKEFHLAEE